jgi:hypothetical protein
MDPVVRSYLVRTVLEWEKLFGVAPSITSSVSKLDVALLINFSPEEYGRAMCGVTGIGWVVLGVSLWKVQVPIVIEPAQN